MIGLLILRRKSLAQKYAMYNTHILVLGHHRRLGRFQFAVLNVLNLKTKHHIDNFYERRLRSHVGSPSTFFENYEYISG